VDADIAALEAAAAAIEPERRERFRCDGCRDWIEPGSPFKERVCDGLQFCASCWNGAADNEGGPPSEMRDGEWEFAPMVRVDARKVGRILVRLRALTAELNREGQELAAVSIALGRLVTPPPGEAFEEALAMVPEGTAREWLLAARTKLAEAQRARREERAAAVDEAARVADLESMERCEMCRSTEQRLQRIRERLRGGLSDEEREVTEEAEREVREVMNCANAAQQAADAIADEIRSAWRRTMSVPEWLERLYAMSADAQRGSAVDQVMHDFLGWREAGATATIDAVLAAADPAKLMVEVQLALLMETFSGRRLFPSRRGFFARVDARLAETEPEERHAGLLRGLEGETEAQERIFAEVVGKAEASR
jgi:hypothetical protein